MKNETKRRFTVAGISKLMFDHTRAPRSGRIEIEDAGTPGLLLRVTPNGVKTLSVIYRVRGAGGVSSLGNPLCGKQQRITLGRVGDIDLIEAQERATEIRRAARRGIDPRDPLRQERQHRHDTTFTKVRERFITDVKVTVRAWKNIERVLILHVEPLWGNRPIGDIRRAEVHSLLDGLVSAGKIGTGREVRKHLSRLFRWAVNRELIAVSPVDGLQRDDLDPNTEAGRALTDVELRHLWRAADELGYPFGPLFQLLALTGQRRGEWAVARRRELDMDRLTLEVPRARHKSKRDHIVALSEPVAELLKTFPTWEDDESDFLLSSRDGATPVSGFSKAKAALDEAMLASMKRENPAATLTPFRVHDLRVTCETRLAALGFNQDIRDAVLGHAKAGLQKNYNKHEYLTEKRAALSAYSAHLLSVVGDHLLPRYSPREPAQPAFVGVSPAMAA